MTAMSVTLAPRGHLGERLVARRVEEGDGPAAVVHAPGTDHLGDAAGLGGDHVAAADLVQQRGLAVIDVAHDGDDQRPRPEVFRVVRLLGLGHQFLFDVGRRLISSSQPASSAIDSAVSASMNELMVILTGDPADSLNRISTALADGLGERAHGDRELDRHLALARLGRPENLLLLLLDADARPRRRSAGRRGRHGSRSPPWTCAPPGGGFAGCGGRRCRRRGRGRRRRSAPPFFLSPPSSSSAISSGRRGRRGGNGRLLLLVDGALDLLEGPRRTFAVEHFGRDVGDFAGAAGGRRRFLGLFRRLGRPGRRRHGDAVSARHGADRPAREYGCGRGRWAGGRLVARPRRVGPQVAHGTAGPRGGRLGGRPAAERRRATGGSAGLTAAGCTGGAEGFSGAGGRRFAGPWPSPSARTATDERAASSEAGERTDGGFRGQSGGRDLGRWGGRNRFLRNRNGGRRLRQVGGRGRRPPVAWRGTRWNNGGTFRVRFGIGLGSGGGPAAAKRSRRPSAPAPRSRRAARASTCLTGFSRRGRACDTGRATPCSPCPARAPDGRCEPSRFASGISPV